MINKTSYDLWHNKQNNFKYFKVFGTEVYTHIHKNHCQKWDAKSRVGFFVGYDECTKGFKVFNLEKNKIVVVKLKNTVTFCLKMN